jgi:hypothetical protein
VTFLIRGELNKARHNSKFPTVAKFFLCLAEIFYVCICLSQAANAKQTKKLNRRNFVSINLEELWLSGEPTWMVIFETQPMMCKILIFPPFHLFFWSSTMGPQSTQDYILTNAFNVYFWAEKNAINAYLSTTCPLLTLTMTNQAANYCLLLVHYYLSTTHLSDTVVRYSVTSPTTNYSSTTCPPLPVHCLSFRYYSEIFSDLSNYRLPVHYLSTTCVQDTVVKVRN